MSTQKYACQYLPDASIDMFKALARLGMPTKKGANTAVGTTLWSIEHRPQLFYISDTKIIDFSDEPLGGDISGLG